MHIPNPDSIYDVFLSSKGGSTDEEPFTSHLYSRLQKAGISVFWDDDDGSLSGEDQISPSLQKAIQRCRLFVVVLTAEYAGSRRCLELLEQIFESRRIAGQFVLPVFLGISRYDVRYQERGFGIAFGDLRKRISEKDKVESWKIVFSRICQIQSDIRVELQEDCWRRVGGNKPWWHEKVEEVVKRAKSMLDRRDLFVAEHLVGLALRARWFPVPLLIDQKPEGVLLLGVTGMVGIGKTTLAKSIYNHNRGSFEGRSFLPNIREIWVQGTQSVYLQERLLSDVYKLPREKIGNIEIGKKKLKEKLSNKKILLVLDDVNKMEQLYALCGSRDWFGPGSMIIITTRDRSILKVHGVEHEYNMKVMDENECGELVNGYVARKRGKQELHQLSRNIVAYTGGLPLALEVLGSKVFGSNDSMLDMLGECPLHPVVKKVLKSCINDLHNVEKNIFLDIVWFLIGMDREKVIKTLAFGNLAEKGVSVLEDKCIVTFDEKDKLTMHVLLRDIGREVIGEQMREKHESWIYDVFLSFRGDGNCATFTSLLYTQLANAHINFFKDDDEIRRGDQISISLLQAIGRSRVCVVVLSNHYANSRWCLQELEYIMECHKTIGQVVVPVFYGVRPSAVYNQTGIFGEAFQNLLKTILVERDKEESWRIALGEIGIIAGIEIPANSRDEGEGVKNVVEHVTHLVDMFVAERPIGIEARVQNVIHLLNCKMSKDVHLIGIWGMGGSGKTTLAKAIYNRISRTMKYEARSFLQNICSEWKQDNGQLYLLEKLLSDINNGTKVKIGDVQSGKEVLIERLRCERILLVLDDVDKLEQLNFLCASREWYGSDSIIIITTRDKCLLNELGVDVVYRMKELDESESAMLLSWHAFKQPSPRENFVGLCAEVVAYCGGLPLALEELGCELFGKDESGWKTLLGRYKIIPHPIIQNVLKRSFDGLSDNRVKNVFVEIACFFVGLDQNEVIQKLNGFGDHLAATSIPVLVDQSLVIVDEMNRLGMHVLLQHMGREIFRQRSGMPRIYDVFFSFSKDTPSSFTSCLIGSLEKAGMSVFWDDDSRSGDDQISLSLLQVIQRCRISVVVLSAGYTGSRRCLEELEQIIECRRNAGQFILPVFIGVDPFEAVGEAFGDLTKRISDKDKVESLKIALARICAEINPRSDYCLLQAKENWRDTDEDIKKIFKCAMDLLDRTNLFVAGFAVGVESHVRDARQLLIHQKDKDVLLLGIWGMAGIGKTTVAKSIYNEIGGDFEGRSFLPSIREVWEQDWRHVYLQERLLSDVYKLPKVKIDNIGIGKKMLHKKLSHKKVLLVLDDVNKLEQLYALCGSREWFGPGSVIIITTRDRSLLRTIEVDHVYRVKEMGESASLELFNFWLSGSDFPSEDEKQNLVASVGGLPLALEVEGLASGMLDRFKEFPHTVVQQVIKRCINDLNDTEKGIFFDIACFLNGMDHEEAMEALNAFKLAKDGMRALEDRCFVTIDESSRLRMHVILQDVGRKIIHEQMKVEHGPWIYDVFLSFRGEDTRAIFTSHLYVSLANAGIYVFKDDKEIRRGDRISISLLQAIRRSRISIVVLSTHYANSRWCLQELEYIMECRRTIGQVVLPVFYDVDPTEVRHQIRMFGEAFQGLLQKFWVDKDKEKSWRRALRDIGGVSGIKVIKFRNECEDIKKIVKDVTSKLDMTNMFVSEHPVGVDSRVEDVVKVLDIPQAKDVLFLGIWGMGGIGKTTVAKAIYNQIGHNFGGRSFLLDVRKEWEKTDGPVSLQNKLLSHIYKSTKIKIDNIEEGKNKLKEKLSQRSILLVLDDVNKQDQLNALCGSPTWFRKGSRIIITTRDKKLAKVGISNEERDRVGSEIYTPKQMDHGESIELFSWHAFKQESPSEEFDELSRNVVSYSGGLPLALEVLGSYLFEKRSEEWKSALNKLEKIPNGEVQEKLRISYDGLSDDKEKGIFLDIACFFIGMDRNDVIQILNSCETFAVIGLSVLEDRCLVTVDNNNKLRMHDLLRDMGRQIIREESLKEPGKRSRLWDPNEVLRVLRRYMGEETIEGLALKFSRKETINLDAFQKMINLRLLQLVDVELVGNFEYVPRDLKWLCWSGFPFCHSPMECYQGNLVAIELEYSNLKLVWKEAQMLDKLKILNLSHSLGLTQTPDFSYLPNLEKLLLEDCPRLSSVSPTIGCHKKLQTVNLKDCKSLCKLPRSIYKLTSLQILILSGCKDIDKLEEDLEQMKSLTTLEADGTGIGKMPYALLRLRSIGNISWRDCKGTSRDVLPSIIWSWTSPTNNISSRMRRSAGIWSCLVSLIVPSSSFQGSSSIVSELPKLRSLRLECSSQLQITGDVALDNLNATNWNEVKAPQVSNKNIDSLNFLLIQIGMDSPVTKILRQSMLQKERTDWLRDGLLPGDKNPSWLTFDGEGDSVTFQVPKVNGRKLKSMMLCMTYSSSTAIATSGGLNLKKVLIMKQKTTLEYEGDRLTSLKDEDWQRVVSNLQASNKAQVVVVFGQEILVKKTRIYLVYDESNDCHADVIVSGGDDVAADMNKNVSGVDDDITVDKNATVSGSDDVVVIMNENVSRVDNMTVDMIATVSDNDVVADVNEYVVGVDGLVVDEEDSVTSVVDYMEIDMDDTVSSRDDVGANVNENAFGDDDTGDMSEDAVVVDDMASDEKVTTSGVDNLEADMNEVIYGVGTVAEVESVAASTVDDVVTNKSENTSGIGDMAADENGIVSSNDDIATDINGNASSVEDMTANVVSGGDTNRFGKIFKLRSLTLYIVKTWPFWFGLLVILVGMNCRYFEKQEGLTSFQVSQSTPDFKEAYQTTTKQIEEWLDEEDSGFKRKRTISSYSQSVMKHVPESQKVEATLATNTLKQRSKGLGPLVQTSPKAFPETSGNEITAQNQENQQLQETPLALNTEYNELTSTAEGVEKSLETCNISPSSLDIPADPTSAATTILPIMDAEDDGLDEDGDLLEELDKFLSESYLLSPAKVVSATSESEVKNLPLITIFNNIQELLSNQLEVLVADGEVKEQLLDYLAQLGGMMSQVPTNLQPLVTEIKRFYEDVVNNFPPIQQVLGNHQRLIDSKNRLEEELKTAKGRQARFSATVSKGKERLDEMSKEIIYLEEKLKAMSEKRDKLQSTLKLSEAANLNINKKVATLLKESEEVVSTLKASKSAFKVAESSKENYDRKLADLKQALGNIRP